MLADMQTYWIYQVLGWLGYSAIGITINLLNGARLIPLLVGHVVLISSSIGLTHAFRRHIQRRRRTDQPTTQMWPILAAGAFIISLIQAALVIGTNLAMVGGKWTITAAVALWWGMFLATAIWTILYVTITERRWYLERLSHF